MDLFDRCKQCGKTLTNDEIGLYKKMVNRGSEEYLCKDCLCNYFGFSVETADELIEKFRNSGCTLFSKDK